MKKTKNILLYIIIILNVIIILSTTNKQVSKEIIIKTNLNQFNLSMDNIYSYFEIIGIDSIYQDEIMSQIIYETGHLCSNVRFRENNLFGMRINNEYKKYNHWTESIVHWKLIFYDKVKQYKSYYDYLISNKKYMECDNIIYVSKLKQIKKWIILN